MLFLHLIIQLQSLKKNVKLKLKNVVGKTGQHKKIISHVRDSHNKPVKKNLKLEITQYYSGVT